MPSRNQDIVDECEIPVAATKTIEKQLHSGTWATHSQCKKKERYVGRLGALTPELSDAIFPGVKTVEMVLPANSTSYTRKDRALDQLGSVPRFGSHHCSRELAHRSYSTVFAAILFSGRPRVLT
jgi:hypothetical protein